MHRPTIAPPATSRLKPTAAVRRRNALPWWAGYAIYALATAVGRLVSGNPGRNRQFYAGRQQQAPWAPPGAVFGIAWSVINVFVVRALVKLLNEPAPDGRSRGLLGLQGLIWAVFSTFGYVYFRKRSPLLCAAWTVADTAAALTSYCIARRKDAGLARNYLPLLAWTSYASTVAVYQALKNDDPLLQTEAPLA